MPKPNETYPENRRCPVCNKKLSIYNPFETCFEHCPDYTLRIPVEVRVYGRHGASSGSLGNRAMMMDMQYQGKVG